SAGSGRAVVPRAGRPEGAAYRAAPVGGGEASGAASWRCAGSLRACSRVIRRSTQRAADPALSLRPATAADLPFVSGLLEVAFGEPAPDDLAGRLDSPHERTVLVEVKGAAVGTLHVTRDLDDAGIYGFAVDPRWQGRGIGRDALRRACEQLRAVGARRIGLEVAVEND